MTAAVRRLVFVQSAERIPAPAEGTLHVVVDTTWTPGPDGRPDVVPIRPAASAVLAAEDLFDEALVRLDAWAAEAGLVDRLAADEVAWWFRAREGLWNWLHERILWRRTIGQLLDGSKPESVLIPAGEAALADVARGLGVAVEIEAGPPADESARQGRAAATERALSARPASLVGRLRVRIARLGGAGRVEPDERSRELDRRGAVLDARITALTTAVERPILVLSHMGIRQPIGGDRSRLLDPNLGSVIDRLRSGGRSILVVGLGLDHRLDDDWPAIAADDGVVPQTWVQQRWDRPVAEAKRPAWTATDDPGAADLVAAIDAGPAVALDIDGVDLGPAALDELRTFARTVLPVARRQIPRVERMLAELRPSALLLTHEGIRTPWLVAARRLGVPSFAVQHGVLYPTHPGYAHPRHPGLVLPTTTFVFGDEERQVLLDHGGYGADEVVASGSPRLDLDSGAGLETAERARERTAVRAELGVAEGDRMLVLSTVNQPFVRRFHATQMLETVLGGALPGIHLIVKLHPGEQDDGPYRALLDGLARVGGYARPAMTIVRDIDLYRLLRAADGHLGLRSTVLTDAVVVGGVNLIATVQAHADMLGYVESEVARPVRTVAELRAALDDARPIDPDARAAFIARHFRPGDASARIAEIVLAARPRDMDEASGG